MKNDDIQLIQRVLAGNDDAFSVLVKKYKKQVHALAWRKIGDFHIAEEITQDTFLKAYKKLATLKKPQRFASWLYVIAANRCSSWLRKKRLWTQPLEQLEETDIEQQQRATYSRYVIEENERIAAAAQRDVVKKLLAKLQESERTVITLHYFGEMSCTEIGAFLGVSANTIKSRLHRAQQRLKKEEPMIREALDNFQITPNLTENIMREIARIKPYTPSSSKPFMPWAIAASTIAVVLLMLGIGNHQYLGRFQKPYSFDATSEMKIELIEAPLVLDFVSKTDKRTEFGDPDTPNKSRTPERKPNDIPALYGEAQTEATVENYAKWELPKEAKARLGKGGINAMQFSPDGTQLAVGSNIGVWLYDVETGKEISLFAGMCQSLSFSPDGRYLVNGGGLYRTTKIQVWDTTTGYKVALIDAPASAAALRFSADSKRLISLSSWGDTISRWDIKTGQGITENLEERQFASGTRFPEAHALTYDKIAIGSIEGKIQLWNTITGEKLSSLREHSDLLDQPLGAPSRPPPLNRKQVLALAFSPNGTRLASGSKDKAVQLWDNTTNSEPIVLQKHTGWTNVLAFSPNGKMLASGSTDKTVQLWNTDTGEPIATLTGHLNGINALAFSPDGTTLASGSTDGTIRFWNIKTGDVLAPRITGHTEWVKGVTFSKDSSTLVSVAFNGAINFWDVKTSQRTNHQIAGHRDWLATLAFSPDGTRLASIGAESTMVIGFGRVTYPDSLVRLTDVSTGRQVATLKDKKGASNLVFSPDGKTVAFGNHDEIRLWNTETDSTLDIPLSDQDDVQNILHNAHENGAPGMMPHQMPQISALVFSPDGTRLASATMEGNVHMWDTETGIGLVSLTEQDPDDVKYGVKAAADADPDATIVSTTFPDVTVVYRDPITALAFSANGKLLAAGSRKQIRLWNMGTGNWGKGISSINNRKDSREVFHGSEVLVFSPDSTVLINGDGNGRIQLWDITTGDEIITLNGHMEGVETLQFSPDGNTLVSAGQDGTILLWDWNEILNGLPVQDK
ncbi:sigma-70 family RNA polymerase sigma factor [Candidatus Poribacteria bacterium]|nr:sigma-70 family RNA polymerase sigma factor [Candidatus Poribacteria bacterium]